LNHRSLRVAAVALVASLAPAASASAAGGVIVQFEPGASAGAVTDLLDGARAAGRIYGTSTRVVRADDPAGLVARLNRSGVVRFAEVDRTLRASAVPNDPRFSTMYGLDLIDAPEAWDALGLGAFPSTGGVKVGIVDTGIRRTHQDIGSGRVIDCANVPAGGLLGGLFGGGGSISDGTCADGNGHGTHVAGTIGALTNNGVGVSGVAFNTTFSVCKGLTDAGSGSTSGIASCIRYLKDKGAKVISMSLGGGSSTALQQAVQYAWQNGAGSLLVAAAGNDGNATLNYPAAYPEVVSVAATDRNDARASFSNANADVEVAAPGVDIVSTWSTSDTAYNTISGTSMATPHAAGVAALIAQRFPAATGQQLRDRLAAATDDLGAAGRDAQFGIGRVDALQAATE
jgi:thermitase